jgi:hypothetical protein
VSRGLILALLLLLVTVPADAREYVRSGRVHRQFLVASGYPHGRPGYVADHKFPLCAGGRDAVENLQWQTVAAAHVKDRAEWTLCRQIRSLQAAFEAQWRGRP